jgi:cardiolipin synthase
MESRRRKQSQARKGGMNRRQKIVANSRRFRSRMQEKGKAIIQKIRFIRQIKDFDQIGLLFTFGWAAQMVNLITLYRIVAAPVLLILIWFSHWELFKWLLMASFLTDLIDGWLARRYKVFSILGARLDSLGDDMTVLVGIIGLVAYLPDFFAYRWIECIIITLLYLAQTCFALWKYKKVTGFHTYLAKLAAFMQSIFLLSAFFYKPILEVAFYIALINTSIQLIEELVMIALLPTWKSDVKGLFAALKIRNKS